MKNKPFKKTVGLGYKNLSLTPQPNGLIHIKGLFLACRGYLITKENSKISGRATHLLLIETVRFHEAEYGTPHRHT